VSVNVFGQNTRLLNTTIPPPTDIFLEEISATTKQLNSVCVCFIYTWLLEATVFYFNNPSVSSLCYGVCMTLVRVCSILRAYLIFVACSQELVVTYLFFDVRRRNFLDCFCCLVDFGL